MTPSDAHLKFAQIAQRLVPDGRLLRAWELKGGVSAQVTALEIEQPDGSTKKVVVRRHGAIDLQRNPTVAAGEFRLLQVLQSAGLPAPAPCYFDQSGDIFPTPYLVVDFVEGRSDFAPADLPSHLLQLAAQLAAIHHVDVTRWDLSFLPQQANAVAEKLHAQPSRLDHSLQEGRIRDALERRWPWPQRNASRLLHGDFWPGNILWQDDRLVAVVDWEDAHMGDPLADLANSRLEMLWAFGLDAMQSFTRHYQALASIDFSTLPHWDLYAALRPAAKLSTWGLDPIAEQIMRTRHQQFVSQAFVSLSA